MKAPDPFCFAAAWLCFGPDVFEAAAQFQALPATRVRSANAAGGSASAPSVPPKTYVVVPTPDPRDSWKLSDGGIVMSGDTFSYMNRKGLAVLKNSNTVLDLANRVMTLKPPTATDITPILPSQWYVEWTGSTLDGLLLERLIFSASND